MRRAAPHTGGKGVVPPETWLTASEATALLAVARRKPLMPPAVSPAMMLRWKMRKNTIVGTAAIADAAMSRFCGVPIAACQMPTLSVSLVGV